MLTNLESLESRTLFSGGPTAVLRVIPRAAVRDATSIQFLVTYSDPQGINAGSLDNRDLRVSGPKDFVRYARAIKSAIGAKANSLVVRYKMTAPGGEWNSTDNGTYTVKLRARNVEDNMGNFADAQTLATFKCDVPSGGGIILSAQSSASPSSTFFSTHKIADAKDLLSI